MGVPLSLSRAAPRSGSWLCSRTTFEVGCSPDLPQTERKERNDGWNRQTIRRLHREPLDRVRFESVIQAWFSFSSQIRSGPSDLVTHATTSRSWHTIISRPFSLCSQQPSPPSSDPLSVKEAPRSPQIACARKIEMYSLPTHSSLQLPLKMQNNEDATYSPAMSTSSSRSATSQMRAFPHGGASSVRRKPSPLWPELEDRKANIEQVYLEAALPSAGLSIYTTESDAGPITPLTPNDLSHFPSTLTPKSGITHQYFLPVDHPLTGSQSPTSIPAVQTAAQSVQRSPPVIQARGSSISPINHTPPSSQFTDNTGSGHTHVNESQSNYQGHYLRAGASRQSSPASGSAARPTSIALQEQSRQLPVEQLSGLNITGAFGVEPHGGNMQRIESKVLPPIPLSRATTGVPGGPAPLPTSRATENAWKTHKPKKAKQEFSVEGLVDSMGMWDASHCYLKDELGRKRRFGEFFDPIDRADDPRHALSRLSSARSGSSRHTHVSRAAISKQKCGGEEWNVPGRKTVVFYIRHFWCGQCESWRLIARKCNSD